MASRVVEVISANMVDSDRPGSIPRGGERGTLVQRAVQLSSTQLYAYENRRTTVQYEKPAAGKIQISSGRAAAYEEF